MDVTAEPGGAAAAAGGVSERNDLTAVERFAAGHDAGELDLRTLRYRELIPASSPGTGEQYAFEVDLDRCTGCKACVTGCHNRNGLDEGETWRFVGNVDAGGPGQSFQQTVTTACHHCQEPACLSGCPVGAYEKDSATGIVRHLDDQCIGCQYCIMKCPYDVPRYDEDRGIVRKCDMCIERLAVGEAPACVQSCPTEAIAISIVGDGEAREQAAARFAAIPSSPDPAYSVPTTAYKTTRPVPALARTGPTPPSVQHGHLALVVLLVATQSSVGMSLAAGLLQLMPGADATGPALRALTAGAVLTALTGMAASLFHLGRPRQAWRAVLGIATSWLSREVVALGAYATLASLQLCLVWNVQWLRARDLDLLTAAGGWLTAASGLALIACSAMVYIDTPRPPWASARTAAKFLLTALIAGSFTGLALSAMSGAVEGAATGALAAAAIATLALKLRVELSVVSSTRLARSARWKQTVALLSGPLRGSLIRRIAMAGTAAIAAVAAASAVGGDYAAAAAPFALVALAAVLAGELAERSLFFASVTSARMPGSPLA